MSTKSRTKAPHMEAVLSICPHCESSYETPSPASLRAIARVNELAAQRVPEDAELDALAWRFNCGDDVGEQMADAITALRGRVAKAEADTRRLDYMTHLADNSPPSMRSLPRQFVWDNDDLRAAIDASIAKEPQDA